MRKAFAALALLVVAALPPSAGAMTLVSSSTWGGPDSDVVNGIASASDGSTYVVGFTRNFGANPPAAFILKYAADGSLAWQQSWDSPLQFSSDEAHEVDVAPDGSVYVVATTFSGGGDAVLLKFSPEGTLLWQRSWGGSANDAARAVAAGADGVYVTGGTTSFAGGDPGLFVLKFGHDGNLVWQRRWGAPGFADGEGIEIGPDGGIYVAGVATRPGGAFAFDAVLLKLDSAGSLVWQRAYSAGEIADSRGGLTVAPDGSIYVAGAMQTTDIVATLVKYTPDGSLEWDRQWGGKSGDSGEGVAVLADGTVVLVGASNSYGQGSDDAFVVLVRPTGRGIEGATFGSVDIDNAKDVAIAPGGTIVVGGTTTAPPPYTFAEAPRRISRLRGSVTTPETPLTEPAGTVSDPAGVVAAANGSETYAGGAEAVIARITP